MYTFGISLSDHDRSYALTKNGVVLCAIEEERLSRIKHGIKCDNTKYTLDTEAEYFEQNLLSPDRIILTDRMKEALAYLCAAAKIQESEISNIIASSLIKTEPNASGDITYIDHHLAHAAHAFFLSPYNSAAILVLDGAGDTLKNGELVTASLFKASGTDLEQVKLVSGAINHATNTIIALENSVGILYQNASALCGFGPFGSGKLMGMSSYGKPLHKEEIEKHIKSYEDFVHIDNLAIYHLLQDLFDKAADFEQKANVAASVQEITNEVVLHYCKVIRDLTGMENLCFTGGVAQNAITNGHILRSDLFKSLYIPSAPGDNGIAIGAALYNDYCIKKTIKQEQDTRMPFYGMQYSDKECEDALKQQGGEINFVKVSETEKFFVASNHLAEGHIIAWFEGGSEFGPRALGHRSILANPAKERTRDVINKIKGREWFRPVAPMILEDHLTKYFEKPLTSSASTAYMVIILNEQRETNTVPIPSAIHVDSSARIQTIDENNPSMKGLINELFELTGCPSIINTSFNVGDEPIVETPEEAIRTFMRSEIDVLVLNNFIVTKTHG